MEDFVKSCEEDELKGDVQEDEDSLLLKEKKRGRKSESTTRVKKEYGKYLVNGRYLSIEEITEIANRPNSEDHFKVEEERQEYSEKLIQFIRTDEFNVNLLTNKI